LPITLFLIATEFLIFLFFYNGRGEACTGFWWGNLRKRDHWGDPGVDGRIDIKMDLQEVRCAGMDWIGLVRDREGAGHL
jgi:hypothetical protein